MPLESAIQELEWLIQGIERGIQMNLTDIDRCLTYINREQENMTKFQGLYKDGVERLASLKQAIKVLERATQQ